MKHLVTTLAALGLCTSIVGQGVLAHGTSSTITSRDGSTVSSGTITSRDGSTVSSGNITSRDGRRVGPNTSSANTGTVILDNQSSVTTSTIIDGTGTTTNSIVGRTGSMCSSVYEGRRCEISCQTPQVAQCGEDRFAALPVCFCK